MKGIKAYKNEIGTYSIIINNSLFEMDSRADQPNGVCIYVKELDDLDMVKLHFDEKNRITSIKKLSIGILYQIISVLCLTNADLEQKINSINQLRKEN